MQSFKSKSEREVRLFKLENPSWASRHYSIPAKMARTLASELGGVGGKGSDVEVSTRQYKRGYFRIHSEKCEGSQYSFLQIERQYAWSALCCLRLRQRKHP